MRINCQLAIRSCPSDERGNMPGKPRLAKHGRHLEVREMSFILGTVLFVAGVGFVDSKLPWPRPAARGGAS